MDDLIRIKCPCCEAVLATKNNSNLEDKNLTCPVCKRNNPFNHFRILQPPTAEKEDLSVICPSCGEVSRMEKDFYDKNYSSWNRKESYTCPLCKQDAPFRNYVVMLPQTGKEYEIKDEIKEFKCPHCDIMLGARNISKLKNKYITCPICQKTSPFKKFKPFLPIGAIVKDYQIVSIPYEIKKKFNTGDAKHDHKLCIYFDCDYLYLVRNTKSNRLLTMMIFEGDYQNSITYQNSKINHPSFIKIIDFIEVHNEGHDVSADSYNSTYYCITDYYDRNLESIIEAEGRFSESKSLEIIKSIGQAVGLLHDKDRFHLDITPYNIFIGDNGMPILMGTGRFTRGTLSDIELGLTTLPYFNESYFPYYDFPEDKPVKLTPSVDTYSLGATLFYMLTGKEPEWSWHRDSERIQLEELELKSQDVSDEVISIIKKAMGRKKDRYQTVSEFLEAIEEAESVEVQVLEASDPGFYGAEENANALPVGTVLKGASHTYTIQKVLGQGTFGITYLATVQIAGALGSINTNIPVAIREFFMRDFNGRTDTTVTSVTNGSKDSVCDNYKKKFIREAKNLSKLQHDNIIKVIEAFEANNTVYYAMEYIKGGSLDDQISRKKRLTYGEAKRVAQQIGSALAFMHDKGMLHLDLKPANVMIREDGTAVLIDFGLSKQYKADGKPETSTKVGAGTPGYAPIEQAIYQEGKGFPVTMDVYALGGTLFKMLTGKRPPEAPEILNEGFPDDILKNAGAGDALTQCIAKAMEPMKRLRYQTVMEFLDALSNI